MGGKSAKKKNIYIYSFIYCGNANHLFVETSPLFVLKFSPLFVLKFFPGKRHERQTPQQISRKETVLSSKTVIVIHILSWYIHIYIYIYMFIHVFVNKIDQGNWYSADVLQLSVGTRKATPPTPILRRGPIPSYRSWDMTCGTSPGCRKERQWLGRRLGEHPRFGFGRIIQQPSKHKVYKRW